MREMTPERCHIRDIIRLNDWWMDARWETHTVRQEWIKRKSLRRARDLGKHWLGVCFWGGGGWLEMEAVSVKPSGLSTSRGVNRRCQIWVCLQAVCETLVLRHWNVATSKDWRDLFLLILWITCGKMYSLEEACWYKIPNPVLCLPVWNYYSWGE